MSYQTTFSRTAQRLCRCLSIVGFLACASTASAATYMKFTDRSGFNAAAGTVKIESFNAVTSDVDLETPYLADGFSLANNRVRGTLGSSKLDASPFDVGGFNGTTYVASTVYNFGPFYSSLIVKFDEAIAAFGANFISGASNQIEMLVDGELVEGAVLASGGFFGFVSDKAFKQIEFRAREGSGYSYSIDNFTFSTSAVPEPASWAMMIGGLGLVGAALRRRGSQLEIGNA